MSARIHSICLALVAILVAGCSVVDDVPLDDQDGRWAGYARSRTYVTLEDVFLLRISDPDGGAPVNFSLTPEASFRAWSSEYGAPDSVRRYLEEGDADVRPSTGAGYRGRSTVEGVVTSGTKIVVVKAVEYHQWHWFFGGVSWVVVYADILDGEFKGLRVDIQDMSTHEYIDTDDAGGLTLLNPDKNLLKEVEVPTVSP